MMSPDGVPGQARIFISYKRDAVPDVSLAQFLYEALKGQGHRVFNVHDLLSRVSDASIMVSPDPHDRESRPGIMDGIMELFQGARNPLRDIFAFMAYVYLKLTWHDSPASYYGRVARLGDDVDPSEFLLDVVNDAKTLRNKVEDFLGVPRNTFENEWPTERRLQSVREGAQREYEALVAEPLDINQLMVELMQ